MAGIRLEKLSRVFPGSVVAVANLDLEVYDRELLVVLGPSGCGKTTLLRLIAGLEQPSSGEIRIADRVVNRVPPKDRDIAMVFQNHALYPHLSVYENMAFGCRLRDGLGWWRRAAYRVVRPAKARELAARQAELDDKVRRAAESLGIESLLDRLPRQLSGGERQRVALGRAVVRQPAAFLLDEPLSNVDARLRVDLRSEVKRLHQQLQTTMMYVTHDQAEALTLGDRIAVMNRGAIEQIGPPLSLYDAPKNRFVAGFLGTPAMNFIEGELRREEDGLRFRALPWSVLLDNECAGRLQPYVNRRAVLGVRPEDVRIGPTPTGSSVAARVVSVESLGDADVVELEAGLKVARLGEIERPNVLVCKAAGRSGLVAGDTVQVELQMKRAHVFDADTGANLIHG